MLAKQYPGSSHVCLCGIDHTQDEVVWEFARRQGYVFGDQGFRFRGAELAAWGAAHGRLAETG
ncbi:MAG: hypothetical protein ACK4TK_11360 [Thiobacillaceae bacterium]